LHVQQVDAGVLRAAQQADGEGRTERRRRAGERRPATAVAQLRPRRGAGAARCPGRRAAGAGRKSTGRRRQTEAGRWSARQGRDGVNQRGSPDGEIGRLCLCGVELRLGALLVDWRRDLRTKAVARQLQRRAVKHDPSAGALACA
jgi:hypothetical protein